MSNFAMELRPMIVIIISFNLYSFKYGLPWGMIQGQESFQKKGLAFPKPVCPPDGQPSMSWCQILVKACMYNP